MQRKKIFGFIQYSILRDNTISRYWNISKKLSFKDLERTLFNSDRLNLRAKTLAEITLPSLRANLREWADFRVIVVTSELLPARHMANLKNICNDYDFVEIATINTEADAFSQAVNIYIDREVDEKEVYYTFRIDDDDALCWDFSDIIKPYLNESNIGVALSLPLGYSGYYDLKKKEITQWGSTYVAMTAIGLGLISIKGFKYRHIFDLKAGSHLFVDRVVPVILLSKEHAYFRTLHDYASMYFAKNMRARNLRTMEKIQRPVNIDEIISRVPIDRTLFAKNNLTIQSSNLSLFLRFWYLIRCLFRCLKGVPCDR